jgi:hypothetical protein
MDEVLKRLGAVELSVSEIKTQLTTVLPHLATKAELEKLRADMNTGFGDLRADMNTGFGALKADMNTVFGVLKADMNTVFGTLKADMNAGFGALKADMNAGFGASKADNSALETRIIKWIIATMTACTGLVFTLAKFVH